MSIEFKVADVELGHKRFPTETTAEALGRLWGDVVVAEAESALAAKFDSRNRPHQFALTVAMAFNAHLPLVITPDAIWLLIVQGVTQAIKQEPEKWRSASVLHEGKRDLIVESPELLERRHDTEIWRRALAAFVAQMRPHLAEPLLQLDARFSTSTLVTSAALEVALLDATREFFSLHLITASGIPSIRLEGTPEDWQSIETRSQKLRDFGLDWWHEALQPILREFTRAAQGHVDANFWRSFFTFDGESGGPILTGWIIRFFPYLEWRAWQWREFTIERNHLLNGPLGKEQVNLWSLPEGISCAPFTWALGDETKSMQWLSGFGGMTQEDSGALRPILAWGAREAKEQSGVSV